MTIVYKAGKGNINADTLK